MAGAANHLEGSCRCCESAGDCLRRRRARWVPAEIHEYAPPASRQKEARW
jgi:hypothetical protein